MYAPVLDRTFNCRYAGRWSLHRLGAAWRKILCQHESIGF